MIPNRQCFRPVVEFMPPPKTPFTTGRWELVAGECPLVFRGKERAEAKKATQSMEKSLGEVELEATRRRKCH